MRKAIGYITGVGITKFGELYDYSLEDLILESAVEALRDSRLKNMAEIDLVVISSMTSSYLGNQGHLSSLATQVLGTECPVISVDAACGGGASALGVVLSWLGSKNVSTALVIGVEKLTDCSAEKVAEGMMLASSYREEAIHGFTFPALAALVARRYFHEYRVDPKVLAKIAVKNHKNGTKNEMAHIKREVTEKEYFASPYVAEPLRLYDCSPISDGAASLIVSKKKCDDSTAILAFSQTQDTLSLHKRSSLTFLSATIRALAEIKKQTGLELKEIDLLELHDAFTIFELISLEDLGFFKKGKGGQAYKTGYCEIDGKLPVNPSGGLKACGHPVAATGIRQIIEIHNQILGKCSDRQIKNAKLGMAQNFGGVAGTCALTLIGESK